MNREPSGTELMESLVGDLLKVGLTSRQIAKGCGISHNTVWRAANRMTTEPMWATYARLRDFHDKVMAGRSQ